MKTLFVILVLLGMTTLAQAQPCYTNAGFVGAAFEKDLDEAIDYAARQDDIALSRMIKDKRAFFLSPGMIVHREKTSGFGKVFIKRPGSTLGVWTVREAVDCR